VSVLKPSVKELVRVQGRIGFLYVEYAALLRDGGSLKAVRETGTVLIPVATVGTLWLGPSVTLTHQAMSLITECGTTVMWMGEDGLAYYGSGRPLNSRTRLLSAQAEIHSSSRLRMKCAREMYAMRFDEEPPRSATTLNKLRGHESGRVKKSYSLYAGKYNISWNGRVYRHGEIEKSDTINQCLTMSHHCLYAVIGGVIHGLGLHPGLSVVHNGTQESFVYDIADLYKTQICVPVAFRVARDMDGASTYEISRSIRSEMRLEMTAERIVPQAVKDIYTLLLHEEVEASYDTIDSLWDIDGDTSSGRNYPL
jgi:CRISPR-associated protein Cas1